MTTTLKTNSAVYSYTQDGYKKYNKQLRAGQKCPALNSILKDMEQFNLHNGITFRCVNYSRVEALVVDDIYYDKGFMSTSKLRVEALAFGGKNKALLRISSRSGRDISPLSSFEEEAEVLIPPGVKFRVIKRARFKDIPVIMLEEI